MALWRTFACKIQLLPHPNADRMEIARCNFNQLVVAKGNYQDGDVIVFAPERAILPDSLKGEYVNSETGISYLTGSEKNRVKAIKLRGEPSDGISLPIEWVLEQVPEWISVKDIPLDIDISEKLGISKYEPPIPYNMSGIVKSVDTLNFAPKVAHHDVEQFRLFADEFDKNEAVICSEKLHGTQINVFFSKTGEIGVSSKGFNSRDLIIEQDAKNLYWQALENSGLINFVKCEILESNAPELYKSDVQLVGEVIPCQKNFTYGQTKPILKLFRFIVNGKEYSVLDLNRIYGKQFLKDHWVPILYHGKFDPEIFAKLSSGNETVSGKGLHIKEGIVIAPEIPRVARRGFLLLLKWLNKNYKPTDEDFS